MNKFIFIFEKKDWKGIQSLNFQMDCERGKAVLLPQPGIQIMYAGIQSAYQ